MSNLSRVYSPISHDEIDFFQIFGTLWRRRALVLSAVLLSVLIAGVYAIFATPVYEVGTILRPAALKDLDALNRTAVYKLPPSDALKRVGAALDSYETRLSYFRSKPVLVDTFTKPGHSPEQAFANFDKSLTLVQPDPKKNQISPFLGLNMQYDEGVNGPGILNDFVQYAIEQERNQVASDLKVIVDNRLLEIDAQLDSAFAGYEAGKESKIARLIEEDAVKRAQLQDELKALRVQARIRREARVDQLGEAIAVARSLNLKRPATPASLAEGLSTSGNIIRTEVNNQQVPLYFLGFEVLEAERSALRKRASDDFTEPRISQIRKELVQLESNRKVELMKARENDIAFVDGVESLRAEQLRLKTIDTRADGLTLVSIDKRAVKPLGAVKPKLVFLLIVAGLIGMVLGSMIALVRGAFKNRLRLRGQLELSNKPIEVQAMNVS